METMAKERSYLPFDLERMTYAMGGGEADVTLKRRFMNVSLAAAPAPALCRSCVAGPSASPG